MFVEKNVFKKKEIKVYRTKPLICENVIYGDLETLIIEFLEKSKSCPPKKLYNSISFKRKLHKFLIEEVNFMAERVQKNISEKGLCAFTQILSDELKRAEGIIMILKKYDAIYFIGEDEKKIDSDFSAISKKECCSEIEIEIKIKNEELGVLSA